MAHGSALPRQSGGGRDFLATLCDHTFSDRPVNPVELGGQPFKFVDVVSGYRATSMTLIAATSNSPA
ncbi:hypothetical protein [[Mycobacterium] zoologicum]|uniref:hypothetical protein n=1 Tax=[Mycobacterium] zoologicum TaxID=2872311 RepID=UPI001CDB3D7F|nr:hypothetical protein [Mycolicibacter sp. MYC101]MEB3063496.1 hypothetical protein [Mycolicibacter sp. MYC101]